MGKLVVIVDFEVKEEDSDAFVAAAGENARESVRLEPGCHRFDVIRAPQDKTRVTFYEVFDDVAAFEAHGEFPHAAAFKAVAKDVVVSQAPRRGELVSE